MQFVAAAVQSSTEDGIGSSAWDESFLKGNYYHFCSHFCAGRSCFHSYLCCCCCFLPKKIGPNRAIRLVKKYRLGWSVGGDESVGRVAWRVGWGMSVCYHYPIHDASSFRIPSLPGEEYESSKLHLFRFVFNFNPSFTP